MSVRGGQGPRRGPWDGPEQAHRLAPSEIDEDHYAGSDSRSGRGEDRDRGRRPMVPGGRRRWLGVPSIVRFAAYIGILATLVSVIALTALRPIVARAVVGWAADNPSALGLPFVAELVREDLGTVLTAPASGDASQVEFNVLPGDTASIIAARLQNAKLVCDARAFVFITTERGLTSKLEQGTYILRHDMTPDQLVTALLVSRDLAISLSLRPGLRLEQIVAKLETVTQLTMDFQKLYDEVEHPPASLLRDYPWLQLPKGASLEGFLAADTYQVLPDVTPDELIRRMLDAFYKQVGQARMDVPAARGLSFYEVLTLASMVERETSLPSDRPLVAGVYQNRLTPKLWPTGLLGSDPTIFYINDTIQLAKLPIASWTGYTFWAPVNGALKDVKIPAALVGYDTYNESGLMPGPICTPSAESIDAALQPDTQAGDLYFVAKGDGSGGTAFAKTAKDHAANVKKYVH